MTSNNYINMSSVVKNLILKYQKYLNQDNWELIPL